MNSEPVVSIISIFFNAEKFFEEAIQSVFNQSYRNWELLLVDDGSTDQSTDIALHYASKYPERVRYFEHEQHQNRGMSATRNLGICNARGEYIAFIDADDVWLGHKLEQQTKILHDWPEAAMVYGAVQCWYSWSGSPEDERRDRIPPLGVKPDTLVYPPTLLTLALQSKAPTACPSDMMLRRKVMPTIGGFEESFRGIYQMFEDQAFLAKLYLKAPVFVASECWDKYRQHMQSCVSTNKGQKYTAGLYYLDWLEAYLFEEGVQDTDVWQALEKKRWRYRNPNLHQLIQEAQHQGEQMKNVAKHMLRRIIEKLRDFVGVRISPL